MAEIEDQFEAAGAQIVWVFTETQDFDPGTAENCRAFVDGRGSARGLCVGDSQTMNQRVPSTTTWDDSPFAVGRGIDILVTRRDMVIVEAYSHGTPSGNDNLTGAQLLERVQAVVAGL